MNLPAILAKRFWPKVNTNGPIPEHCTDLGPCWVWTAAKNKCGYGSFGFHKKHTALAHRVSFFSHNPNGDTTFKVLHHCDNPPCVNPGHLYLGTMKDNSNDRERRGRGGNRAGVQNSLKTECRNGHPYSEVNTYKTPSGSRKCRICQRKTSLNRYYRKKYGK